MRLLNVETFELVSFHDEDRPRYAIASHRWATGSEASLQDVVNSHHKDSEGWRKIINFVNFIKTHAPGLQWLWINTCCIDSGSSAELSEAINLSFRQFREADLCIAHLADTLAGDDRSFRASEWFTRAWTLQELLAPRVIIFASAEWDVIGHKGKAVDSYAPDSIGRDLTPDIAAITGIPRQVLHDFNASFNLSVEQRLRWMDNRASTRPEDMYYAMYGIFDVQLGANYGEGHTGAKRRLMAGIKEAEQERNRNFVYDPLDDPGATVRLLTILEADEQEEPIRCHLSHRALNSSPNYVALSYHWGNPKNTVPIRIMTNGVPGRESLLSITASLDLALRELRRRGVSTVWADMACINQADVFERNQQIKLMGRIYAEATKVVAWTGAACDGSSAAIRAMLKDDKLLEATATTEGKPTSLADDIRAFLSRAYFTRAWIIQELAKARIAEIWCGEDTLQLEDLNDFISDSKRARLRPTQETLFRALRLFHEHECQSRIGVPRMLLCQALIASRSAIASDPRDNIYAILGLTLDGEHVVAQPDYSSNVEDVFAEASRRMIGNQGHTSLMLLARGSHDIDSKASWMPDWSERMPLPPWITACLHKGRDTLDIRSSIDGNTLTVTGYCVDEVWEDILQEPNIEPCKDINRMSIRDWQHKFLSLTEHQASAYLRNYQSDSPSGAKLFVDGVLPVTDEIHLLTLESGIRKASRYAMRLVHLRNRGFRMAHQNAEHRDQIWRLENCGLPVVLRPLSKDRFAFIGEVAADVTADVPIHVQGSFWWHDIWRDFDPDPGMQEYRFAGGGMKPDASGMARISIH